jgi:N-acetyl sugar amidotransferase
MHEIKRCSFCVMDETAIDIKFTRDGKCNYCSEFLLRFNSHLANDSQSGEQRLKLETFVKQIIRKSSSLDYDCVVGVSGGVDSSWVLVQAVKLGLRPLAVHMDNGWNSNAAVSNIGSLIEELGVDLYTYVIDWEEYRSLMLAFFKADVVDIELLYDNALHEVCYSQAKKYGVEYILSGSNLATEGFRLPPGWSASNKWDGRNIRSIASKMGGVKLVSFPIFTSWKWLKYTYLNSIKWVSFLDLMAYDKEAVIQELEKNFGYTRYPYKHYESVFTRFYQGFLLPKKFGVDKRIVHFSTLIASGQMTRNAALKDLNQLPYSSERDLEIDRKFFLKKMMWRESDLEEYLARPARKHEEFSTDPIIRFVFPVLRSLLRFGRLVSRKFKTH